MPHPVLTLLAAKAKAGALVAGTALATTAVVGGGTVVYSAVSDSSDVTAVAAADAPATATATIGVGNGKGQGAANRSATATAVLSGKSPAPTVTFSCDPSKNHGQNVSAYAKSLPKGPGRGQQVSQVAKSDCGKPAGEVEAAETEVEESEAPKPVKSRAPKPAKAEKAQKADKPAKPEQAKGPKD